MRWLCLDTETSGFGPKVNRLIEIGVLEFDPETGRILKERFHSHLNPGMPINVHATKVHGKTWQMLKKEPSFAKVAKKFQEFITGAHLVIHNAPFDTSFINAEFERVGLAPIESVAAEITDTLAMAKKLVSAPKFTLDTLCDHFSIDRSKRTLHGALVDCEMLAQVYPKLAEIQALKSKRTSLYKS